MKDLSVEKLLDICKKEAQVECPLYHHFSPGLYVRELNVPADTVLIGFKQKFHHLNIFLKGKVTMVINGEVKTLEAPMIFTGNPGRKVGHVIEDMVWLNVYPTNETSVEKIEEIFLDKDDAWTEEELAEINMLNSGKSDQEDFQAFLEEYNLTEEIIQKDMDAYPYNIEFPSGSYSVSVFSSPIHGKGLFATAPFKPGDFIAYALLNKHKTPAGRYTNHGANPNAKFVKLSNGDVALIAIKVITGSKAGIIGNEITIDYREALKLHNSGV